MKIKVFGALVLSAITMSALAACASTPADPSGEGEGEGGGDTPVVEKVNLTYHYNYPFVSEEDEGYVEEPEAKVVEVEKGKAVEAMVPTLEGYVFAGWYEGEAKVIGEGIDFEAGFEADTEVYACWEEGEFAAWSMVGSMSGWDPAGTDYDMETEDGKAWTIENVTMDEGTEFKAVQNHQWNNLEMASDKLTDAAKEYFGGAGNIVCTVAGVYNFTFNVYKGTIDAVRVADGGSGITKFAVYVNLGSLQEMEGPADAKVGKWTLNNVEAEAGAKFKIHLVATYDDGHESGGSDFWLGASTFADLVDNETIGKEDDMGEWALSFIESGTYNFEFEIAENYFLGKTLKITKAA